MEKLNIFIVTYVVQAETLQVVNCKHKTHHIN